MFEIKTAKPNRDIFTKSKTKLLEWIARRRKSVKVFLVFPYNLYYLRPYSQFNEQGVLERAKDFLAAKEYWGFLGGENMYEQLLELFDRAGKKFKQEIYHKIKPASQEKIDV